MADLQNILAVLAAQQSQSNTPAQNAPPPLPGQQYHPQYASPPAAGQMHYGLPQPTNSGSFDLGGIKPINSGSVSITDAFAQAREGYDPRSASRNDPRANFQHIRSPSPPRGRDNFRDNHNPYRDERRGGNERNFNRDRSFSPRRERFGSPTYRERSPQRGGGGAGGAGAGGESDSEVVAIDKGLVGLIIGRGGENLRRVESQTGARVQFIDSADTPGTKRHCRVSGGRMAVAGAKAEIHKIIEDNELAKRGQDKTRNESLPPTTVTQEGDSLQVMVPDRTVGLIIGRGGETIRDLQERSGCHVNIVGENKSVNGHRPVNLIGSAASQRHAKDLIFEIVESDQKGISIKELRSRQDDPYSKINDTIMVPGEAVGMIIGKGGETIREMQDRTGCKINVSPASGRDIEREIGLIGTRNAIEAAKRAILEKVDAVGARNRSQPPESDNYDRYAAQSSTAYPAAAAPQPQPAAPAAGGADPYAPYGGYENYARMWYAAVAAQQQQPGGQGQGEQR
ncbi:hypothetical protein LTR70_010468 [Exophiala xenobiotica]|uniref:K Homology domain-containing protein n=1 Tax=Lithohypha guttulata TaxID=1690604 RepID=A0ABR0JU11_9EURO|nr:hypothetical protein LTR24_010410 [Lithohypha guttulata]KAK5309234.1 hypothetical protein LTR70_010468 [Exophiala xenobiotica]